MADFGLALLQLECSDATVRLHPAYGKNLLNYIGLNISNHRRLILFIMDHSLTLAQMTVYFLRIL